jgi:hypothetical protein
MYRHRKICIMYENLIDKQIRIDKLEAKLDDKNIL